MYWLATAILTGVVSFAATNIDDIFVLMLFFSQTGGAFRNWHVVAGQYLGFAALVALSVLGSLGVLVVPGEWIGLLGLVPVFLGVRALVRLRTTPDLIALTNEGSGLLGDERSLEPPAAGRLSEIRAPALVVVGELERTEILAAADLLAREVPGAEGAVMRGTAHLPSMERPEEFNSLVGRFLRRSR